MMQSKLCRSIQRVRLAFLGLMIIANLSATAIAKNLNKSKEKEKSISMPSLGLLFSVEMGDKNTEFELREEASQFLFSIKQNSLLKRRGTISAKDFNFYSELFKQAAEEKSNSREYCMRQNMQLRLQRFDSKEKKSFACIGSKTKIAVKMSKLANALSLLL